MPGWRNSRRASLRNWWGNPWRCDSSSRHRKKLGKNIKKIRTRKGISQGDICRALDMDRGYMSAIENGKKNITIQQLERLAQALGVSVDKLLK